MYICDEMPHLHTAERSMCMYILADSAFFAVAFFLRARVFFVVGAGEVLVVEVGVDLRGGEVFVAEQFLHATQVAGGLQDVAGKVWRSMCGCTFTPGRRSAA